MRGRRQSCTLEKDFPTITGTGSTAAWQPVQSFNAVLSPVSQKEQLLADDDTEFRDYILKFAAEAITPSNHEEINGKNRIKIGARYYNIIGRVQHTSRGKTWRLRLRDITDQTES